MLLFSLKFLFEYMCGAVCVRHLLDYLYQVFFSLFPFRQLSYNHSHWMWLRVWLCKCVYWWLVTCPNEFTNVFSLLESIHYSFFFFFFASNKRQFSYAMSIFCCCGLMCICVCRIFGTYNWIVHWYVVFVHSGVFLCSLLSIYSHFSVFAPHVQLIHIYALDFFLNVFTLFFFFAWLPCIFNGNWNFCVSKNWFCCADCSTFHEWASQFEIIVEKTFSGSFFHEFGINNNETILSSKSNAIIL